MHRSPLHHRAPFLALLAVLVGGCVRSATDDKPVGNGTEIGDEGNGWLCIEELLPITELDVAPAGFGVSAGEVLDSAPGDFSSTEAELSIVADPDDVQLFDNEPADLEGDVPAGWTEPECEDAIYVGAVVELDAPGFYLWTEWANLAIAPDGTTTLSAGANVYENFIEDPDDDEGGGDDGGVESNNVVELSVEPTTFAWADMMTVELVVDGVRTSDGWQLTATLRGDTQPMGDDATVESREETIWTGTVTAE
jgi:hypothetical protein